MSARANSSLVFCQSPSRCQLCGCRTMFSSFFFSCGRAHSSFVILFISSRFPLRKQDVAQSALFRTVFLGIFTLADQSPSQTVPLCHCRMVCSWRFRPSPHVFDFVILIFPALLLSVYSHPPLSQCWCLYDLLPCTSSVLSCEKQSVIPLSKAVIEGLSDAWPCSLLSRHPHHFFRSSPPHGRQTTCCSACITCFPWHTHLGSQSPSQSVPFASLLLPYCLFVASSFFLSCVFVLSPVILTVSSFLALLLSVYPHRFLNAHACLFTIFYLVLHLCQLVRRRHTPQYRCL